MVSGRVGEGDGDGDGLGSGVGVSAGVILGVDETTIDVVVKTMVVEEGEIGIGDVELLVKSDEEEEVEGERDDGEEEEVRADVVITLCDAMEVVARICLELDKMLLSDEDVELGE